MNCFNGERYLEQAIESVISQTYENWEIIFWDNQSTDRSAEIFKQYNDSRMRYFYAPTHTTLYDARNSAIKNAAGEFVAFLDADDWWESNKLERQIELFSDPKVGIVCANYWLVNERKNNKKLMFKKQVPTGWVLNKLLKNYYPGLLTLVIRKIALNDLGYIFNSRYNLIGDMDLIIRLSIEWKLDAIAEPLAFYRLHNNNLSLLDSTRNSVELEEWISQVGDIKARRTSPSYRRAKLNVSYVNILNKIISGDRVAAIFLLKGFPISALKIKLLMAIATPEFIIRKIRR